MRFEFNFLFSITFNASNDEEFNGINIQNNLMYYVQWTAGFISLCFIYFLWVYTTYIYIQFLLLCFFLFILRLLLLCRAFCLFLLLRFALHLSAMHHCANIKMHIMFGLLCILHFFSIFYVVIFFYSIAQIDSSNVQNHLRKDYESINKSGNLG